jgi:CheY-like chemotaxis protein
VWNWIDAHPEFGIGRPYLDKDPAHVAPIRVVEACNAHEALDLLGHGAANVKAVISDIRMPGSIDGVGLARTIRSSYPAIKVLLAAGHIGAFDATEHDGFFQKPYDTAKIIRHVRKLLGHPE